MTQKQWILSSLDLSHLQMALATEIHLHRNSARPVPHHLRNLEDLASRLETIRENIGRVYSGDDDMDGEPCERLLVTLIEQSYSDWWDEDPYTVVPVGDQWGVFLKAAPLIPVGEKLHSQSTHAHRAKRRLNAAARERKARSEAEAK